MWLGVMWAAAAAAAGFAAGRASMYERGEGVEEETAERDDFVKPSQKKAEGKTEGNLRKSSRKKEARLKFWSVGSPVSGEVAAHREGEYPVVVIRPDCDRLYAPVGGKVTRLFPMGNSFLFATEFGAELYIQAGEVQDELLGRYYRPKVVQNEIVGKGKLLLEFDRQGLEAAGASPEVCVSVENCFYGENVRIVTEGERVKTGDEILWVAE